MASDLGALLKYRIKRCLPVLCLLVKENLTPHQVWTKDGSSWRGEFVLKPDLTQVFIKADRQLRVEAQSFSELFLANHPEYNGMVGIRRYGLFNFGHDITHVFRSAIAHLWKLNETFDLDETAVDSLVDEFEDFVKNSTIRLLFRAQLLNFRSTCDSIDLPNDLRIRRMTEKEVSAVHGGTMESLGMIRPQSFGLHEFCIEGITEEVKCFGNQDQEEPPQDNVQATLNKAVQCLRTYKEGRVGYDYVHFYPLAFCPLMLPSIGYGEIHVPFGTYSLDEGEIRPLTEHAKMVFKGTDPSMEMACSRLADSETRISVQDRLVDAVIGMEAILLAGLNSEDRKGELKYRFSLHYSTLFATPADRHREFRVAKDLYDLRSMVAHGNTIDKEVFRVGEEKLKLADAAKKASDVLRYVVKHFLPYAQHAPYKKHEFWERSYFGL